MKNLKEKLKLLLPTGFSFGVDNNRFPCYNYGIKITGGIGMKNCDIKEKPKLENVASIAESVRDIFVEKENTQRYMSDNIIKIIENPNISDKCGEQALQYQQELGKMSYRSQRNFFIFTGTVTVIIAGCYGIHKFCEYKKTA